MGPSPGARTPVRPAVGTFNVPLLTALVGALLANSFDAASTWIGVTRYEGHEASVLGSTLVHAWGLIPALVVLKGSVVLLTMAFALTGTDGDPRWWRARIGQRWMIIAGLWIGTAWFGYLAIHNAMGAWAIHRLRGW